MDKHSSPSPMALNQRALTDAVDQQQALAYRNHLIQSGIPRGGQSVPVMLLCACMALLFLGLAVSMQSLLGWVILLPLSGLFVAAIVHQYRMDQPEHEYRLFLFAQSNGLTYDPRPFEPALPGMIFNHGTRRKAVRRMYTVEATPHLEFGDFETTHGAGKNIRFDRWGYVATQLMRPAPHMVLDAKQTRTVEGRGLPGSISGRYEVALNDEFDQDFTLYCANGAAADAARFFNPQLLRRLQENPGRFDLEVVDDWMFAYIPWHIINPNTDTWSWLSDLTGDLRRAAEQWSGVSAPTPDSAAPDVSDPGNREDASVDASGPGPDSGSEPTATERIQTRAFSPRRLVLTVACLSVCVMIAWLVGVEV